MSLAEETRKLLEANIPTIQALDDDAFAASQTWLHDLLTAPLETFALKSELADEARQAFIRVNYNRSTTKAQYLEAANRLLVHLRESTI